MSDSELPSKKSNGGLIAVGLLLLLGAGGAVVWKLTSTGEPEIIEEPAPVVNSPAPEHQLHEAPPPPPSEEELAEEEKKAEETPKTSTVKSGGGPAGCGSTCVGSASADLQSALRARAGQARGCYNRALQNNSSLEGKMSVAVKISPSGAVCSASVTNDTLGEASVSSCVAQLFRSGQYPAPSGGCVETVIPLNFVSQQ